MNKYELYNSLTNKGLFWSYDTKSIDYLSDIILIEQCLLYGEVDDIIELFKLFEFDFIKDVWNKKLVPDERHYGLNYYLAMIWFDINEPEIYLNEIAKENSRYEKLKCLN